MMDNAAEMAEFLAWFGILVLASALFAGLVSWRVRSSANRVRVGIEWLVLLAALVYAVPPALRALALQHHEAVLTNRA